MSTKSIHLAKNRITRWNEAKWAVKRAAYFEYLPNYEPGWICFSAMNKLFPHALAEAEIAAYAKAGVDYMVFYKPGLFPSHLDRKHGMRRYRAWVEYFLRGKSSFSSDEEFNRWLTGWELEVKQMVNICHSYGIKVIMCCSDGFNKGGHVFNEHWFGGPDHWETEPAKLSDPSYTRLPEGDLIAPTNASTEYIEFCRISAEQLIADFGIDGVYYDDNAQDIRLLQATAEVVHRHGRILMLHHSSDNMTPEQFHTADYWYTGEHSYCTPYDFLCRRQTMGAGFMYGISLSNDFWGGVPNSSNTDEAVGFGFLMCALKFPMLYPGDPVAEKLWKHYLPLYKQMVKPGTTAYVCVTASSFVQVVSGQLRPHPKSPLFYNVFVNDHIYLLFTNNADQEAMIKLTHVFRNMETNERITEAKLPPKSVLMLVKV